MLTTALTRRTAIASLVAVSVVLISGGAVSSLDKAGGSQGAPPVVLTMANVNGLPDELAPFAAAAARLSGNTLRIDFKNHWREGSTSNETGVIGDVEAGKVDLAWAGSRAFHSVGVSSFDALDTPLLIDSYSLEGTVLESSLVGGMLAGLKPLGLVGLGILPGPMRKPLGVWPLVRPQDYLGRTLAYSRSWVAEQTMHALGASGVEIPAAGPIEGYDGVESHVAAIAGNSYDSVAGFLTGNVNLWPRPLVLFMNEKAFESLTGRRRSALSDAVRVAFPVTLALEQSGQRDATAQLCRRGLNIVMATSADLAALRQAVQPVYTLLDGDAQTRAAIGQISAMRETSTAAATPDAATCTGTAAQPTNGQATRIDGVYVYHTTLDELRASDHDPSDYVRENYGDYEMILNRGVFTQVQPLGDRAAGTYTVIGGTLTLTFTQGSGGEAHNRPGEVFTYHWSLYRDQLTLATVQGQVSPGPLTVKSWTRIGDVP